jgi:hypothetical protein
MSALTRIAHDMRVAAMGTGDRAYHGLRDAVANGTEIDLSDHDLVLALGRRLWSKRPSQLGLRPLLADGDPRTGGRR